MSDGFILAVLIPSGEEPQDATYDVDSNCVVFDLAFSFAVIAAAADVAAVQVILVRRAILVRRSPGCFLRRGEIDRLRYRHACKSRILQ